MKLGSFRLWLPSDKHLLLALAALAIIFVFYNPAGKNSDWPAWIQAVGSVLAIIAALWIAEVSRQSEQQEKRHCIFAVAEAAHGYAREVRQVIDSSSRDEGIVSQKIYDIYHHSVTDSLAKALADIPFHEVGSPAAVQALLSMQGQFAFFLPQNLEKFMAGPHNNPEMQNRHQDYDNEPEPRRSELKKALSQSQYDVLAKNVRVNLDCIDKHFAVVERALGQKAQ